MLTQHQIIEMQNKMCPNQLEEALLSLLKQVSDLEYENLNLKDEIKRLQWSLTEHD
jgi:hypothetical protein